MTLPRVLFVLAALAGCAAPGPGDQGTTGTASAERNAAVLRSARAMLASGDCRDAEPKILGGPYRMDDPLVPGAARQAVLVEGCGGRGLLNFAVVPAPGGGVRVAPMFPGTTAAGPALQRDGLRQALLTAKAAAPGCDRFTVDDTRFRGPAETASGGGGGAARPWGETWVLGACGRRLAVAMEFAPDERGASIRVDARAVRPLD